MVQVRVGEVANASRVLNALNVLNEGQLVRMRAAMRRAARMLDYGPNGRLAHAVLARFARVASGAVPSVPASSATPLRPLPVAGTRTAGRNG